MGVINCPKTMPPFGCSEIFKLFPRRVSFRETHLLESSRLLIGIGKSKSPLFLASLWLSALCEPSARGWGLLPSVTMGFWLGKGRGCLNESRSLLSPGTCLVLGAGPYCLPGHVSFAQHSPSLSRSGPGTVESMGKTLEPQDMSPREVFRPHWGCQDSFLGQGGFSLL